MRNADHRTLVGGSLGETQYVDSSDHVHIHFLDEGRIEVCCHGCGKSLILVHQPSKSIKARESAKGFMKEHSTHFIPGVCFEDWCPDIRTSVQIVDITKRGLSQREEDAPEH